jgi:predicted metal-dependent HD superfamily phosphohydrolase
MTQPEVEIRRAWRHVVGTGHDRLIDALLLRYAEPHRYYHTAAHIMMVLRSVHDVAAMSAQQPTPELVAAALYHDAVYQPRQDDNEANSAALAMNDLSEAGWSRQRCQVVEAMIMATAGHELAPRRDPMDQTPFLIDADLSILGADPLAYQAYANGVRAEYFFVDEPRWRSGRAHVLQQFLGRQRIYWTDYMHREHEHRARANIEAELVTLR